MSKIDTTKEDIIFFNTGKHDTQNIINSIFKKYIEKENINSIKVLLKDINHEMNKAIEESKLPIQNDKNLKNVDNYLYYGELYKIYNQKSHLGITIRAEYKGKELLNIEGFFLELDNSKINYLDDKESREYLNYIKDETANHNDEKIIIYKHDNKESLQSAFNNIKEEFIENLKLKERLEIDEEYGDLEPDFE